MGKEIKIKYDILGISKEASALKAVDNTVVDGTLGTFYYDDGLFHSYKTIKNILENLNDHDYFSYTTSSGGPEYEKAVLTWVFKNKLDVVLGNTNCRVIATPGGTGALFTSVFETLNAGDSVVFHDLCWEPYITMSEINGINVVKYNLFDENFKYNMNDFIAKCEMVRLKQGKITTILNDLCNNPTGFTLSVAEFKAVCDYLCSLSEKVTLVYDIAYFDYTIVEETMKKFEMLSQLTPNVTVMMCFSGSKSFCMYGLRLGAQIIMNKNKELVDKYAEQSSVIARTHWSNVNRAGMSTLIKLISDDELKSEFQSDLLTCQETLKKRIEVFNIEAKKVGLVVYPSVSGFFISFPVSDPDKAFIKLKENNIFLIPLIAAMRMAICSIPLKEVYGLATKIKSILDEYHIAQ